VNRALFALSGSGQPARPSMLISLALNLFLLGILGAVAVRGYAPAASTEHRISWTPASRIERLASALPAADASELRVEFQSQSQLIDALNAQYRSAQEHVRAALRAEPFVVDAVRAAMADMRVVRQKLEAQLQDVIATASAKMSSQGRQDLADWMQRRRANPQGNR
jgi:uncharacterized membrane protein